MNFVSMFQKVQTFMAWDEEKTLLWFNNENPLLGNTTPMHLLKIGRAHKLEKFIDGCIDEGLREQAALSAELRTKLSQQVGVKDE